MTYGIGLHTIAKMKINTDKATAVSDFTNVQLYILVYIM
jgi:hypothetical protein